MRQKKPKIALSFFFREYPYYIEQDNTEIAFEAKLNSGDGDLRIYLKECWAAPSDDIYDTDKVVIMNNGLVHFYFHTFRSNH